MTKKAQNDSELGTHFRLDVQGSQEDCGEVERFPLQDGTWDFPGDAVAGKGLIL